MAIPRDPVPYTLSTAAFQASDAACGFAASTLCRRAKDGEIWAEAKDGTLVPGAVLKGSDYRWNANAFWLSPSDASWQAAAALSERDREQVRSMVERMARRRPAAA